MSLITSGSALSALRPGIHDWWGLGYNRYPEQCKQIFEMLKTSMNYERDVNMYGLNLAKVRPEGTATQYDEMGEGFNYDYIPVIYSSGTQVTHQAIINNLYMKMGEEVTKELGDAMRETKEIVHANIFNRAFSSSVQTFADGNELCSTSHSLAGGGTFSNKAAVDADLSEAILEEAITTIRTYTDDRGKKRLVRPKKLIVHPADQFEARRILRSDLRPRTAENDLNALKDGGYFPEGHMVYDYLSDSDAFFVLTDCPKGLRSFEREATKFDRDVDFDTDNIKIKAVMQFAPGVTDVMAVWGSQGS